MKGEVTWVHAEELRPLKRRACASCRNFAPGVSSCVPRFVCVWGGGGRGAGGRTGGVRTGPGWWAAARFLLPLCTSRLVPRHSKAQLF